MTIITGAALHPFDQNRGTIPSVVPFTIRENPSLLMLVEEMRVWITNELVPFVNDNVKELAEEWVTEANKLIENWKTLSEELLVDVNVATSGITETLRLANLAKAAAESARDLAETYASEAAAVQVTAITGIFVDTESAFRKAIDLVYAKKSELKVIDDLTKTGRLSPDSIAAGLNGKVDKTTFTPISDIINTGRLSTSKLNTTITENVDAKTIYGNRVERPAADTLRDGTQFASFDIPELYMAVGDEWKVIGAGGNMLGYAEQVPLVSGDSTENPKEIPGLSSTFVVGDRPIEVSATVRFALSAAGGSGFVQIRMDGNEIGKIDIVTGAVDKWQTYSWSRVIVGLMPGSVHTVTTTFGRGPGAANRALVGGDPTNPNILKVSTV